MQSRRTPETGPQERLRDRQGAPPPRRRADLLADVRRQRAAGGPEDQATYACTCGRVFRAPVSTGVACPWCGDAQAW